MTNTARRFQDPHGRLYTFPVPLAPDSIAALKRLQREFGDLLIELLAPANDSATPLAVDGEIVAKNSPAFLRARWVKHPAGVRTPLRRAHLSKWRSKEEANDAITSLIDGVKENEEGAFEHLELDDEDEEGQRNASDPLLRREQTREEPRPKEHAPPSSAWSYKFGSAYKTNRAPYRLPKPKWDDMPKEQRIALFKAAKVKWYPPAGSYCYIHWGVYEDPATRKRERNWNTVCQKCRTMGALGKASTLGAFNHVLHELEVRLPYLFAPPFCPASTRDCECQYVVTRDAKGKLIMAVGGCKARIVQEPKKAAPLPEKTREELLEEALLAFLLASGGRFEGTQRELAQRLHTDQAIIGPVLQVLREEGTIRWRNERGRYGGTIIEIV